MTSTDLTPHQYTPLPEPVPITEQNWPEGTVPLVSICCITYNHEKFIEECLEGFLMQETTFPVEILIHDDASTDRTADIIREYAARYPQLFRPIYQIENQYSQGKKPNLMFNFPRAKGKYIALCEGDDYWMYALKLQMQVDFLEKNKDYSMNCHASKVIFDKNPHNSQLSKISDKDETLTLNEEFLSPFSKNRIRTESVVFRSQHIRNYPAWTKKIVVGDFPLFLILSSKGKIWYFNQIISSYRNHSGGVWTSNQKNNDYIEKYYLSTIEMYQYFNEYTNKKFDSQIQILIKNRYYKLFRSIHGNYKLKTNYLKKYGRNMSSKYRTKAFIQCFSALLKSFVLNLF